MTVTEYSWERLLEDLPLYLYNHDGTNDGSLVQIRDVETGHRVLFHNNGWNEVIVPIPEDPVAAGRLVEVLRSNRTTNVGSIHLPSGEVLRQKDGPMWGPSSVFEETRDTSVRQCKTGWPNHDRFRREIAAALVEVLRDGLGATPQRLRYTAADNDGPADALYGGTRKLTSVAPDRPSHRGAAETCTDWGDFAERLEWAITTLPSGQVLTLYAPSETGDTTSVEFFSQFEIHSQCLLGGAVSLDRTELRARMDSLGWQWAPEDFDGVEYPIWKGPRTRTLQNRTLGELVPRTVATLRDIFGAKHPQELSFAAEGLRYLDTELGVRRRRD